MTFKVGDEVVCVNDKGTNQHLVKGNNYKVVKVIDQRVYGDTYIILENVNSMWLFSRFILAKPKFEVGKWYNSDIKNSDFLIKLVEEDCVWAMCSNLPDYLYKFSLDGKNVIWTLTSEKKPKCECCGQELP